ncbi:MAG: hypothetical protein WCG26_11495 [Chloroflexales bacterium]
MTDTISPETQRAILTDMRRLWLNTRFQTETELKIQDRLSQALSRDTSEAQRALVERLREVEVAVALLDAELTALAG